MKTETRSLQYSLLTFPEWLETGQRFLPYALLLSVTFALYGTTLYFGFVWDDFAYVLTNYRVHGLDWMHLRAFWTGTYLGHYAPVHHTFLALLHHFSGTDPFGYHLGQFLVHAASVCMLYFVLKKMEMPRVALLAGLLFAVHPANVETVAWISESKSTLAFLFFLLSFWFFIRLRERERWTDGALSGLFLVLSVLAKINTVVAPAIFLLYDYKQGASLKRLRWWSLGYFFSLSLLFVGVHLSAFHRSPQAMEGVYFGGLAVHLMNLPLLLSFYVQMIVFPHPLSAWQMVPVQGQFNWLVGLGWAGLLATAWFLARASRTVQFWALWIVVFLLPVLQIIPFPIWVADRYLYISAIGGFVLASQLFFRTWERLRVPWPRWGLECAMIAAVLLFAWRTVRHVPVWKSDLALWEATTPTCMGSAYCHMNLGLALLQNGHTERGIKEMIRSAEIRPGARFLERLGDALSLAAGDYRQATVAYTMALEKEGRNPTSEVYAKLARVHLLEGNLDEAARVIDLGKEINPNDPSLWIADGLLQWRLGNNDQARLSLRRALAMTGRTSNPAEFIYQFWGNAADVGRLLADLRRSQPVPSNK